MKRNEEEIETYLLCFDKKPYNMKQISIKKY